MDLISPEFLLIFLPATLLLFHFSGKLSATMFPYAVLSSATLFFYSFYGSTSILALLMLVLANFIFSHYINAQSTRLITGLFVACNVLYLIFFKYIFLSDFLTQGEPNIIALVGVSYFTLQQAGYLMDLRSSNTRKLNFIEYSQFVLFFPIVTSGPIIRSHEFSDFFSKPKTISSEFLLVGLVIVSVGVSKKIFLSDPLGPGVSYVYDTMRETTTFSEVWIASIAFTLQVYFDFSGYSDIAIGLARCFGIVLPLNFLSPMLATNIQDLWLRWHMSMTRFFKDYVYTPISLRLTRLAFKRKWGRSANFAVTVALPTILTFCLVGMWHNIGINFLIFGILHGFAVTFYHWQSKKAGPYSRNHKIGNLFNWLVTVIFFVFTLVLFRAESPEVTMYVWQKMLIPDAFAVNFNVFDWRFFASMAFGTIIVLFSPSLPEFFQGQKIGLDYGVKIKKSILGRLICWNKTRFWAALFGLILGIALIVTSYQGLQTFVYVRF